MSKLLEMLENTEKYSRLNSLSAHSPNVATPKNFSARNQSDLRQGREAIIAGNAVDFFGNTYQDGFDAFKPSMSVTGFKKSDATQTSDFTGDPTADRGTANNAFDSYNRFANDSMRKNYDSKLIHKYLATDTTKQYKTTFSTSEGLKLVYNV
jgi:hypothetical protein